MSLSETFLVSNFLVLSNLESYLVGVKGRLGRGDRKGNSDLRSCCKIRSRLPRTPFTFQSKSPTFECLLTPKVASFYLGCARSSRWLVVGWLQKTLNLLLSCLSRLPDYRPHCKELLTHPFLKKKGLAFSGGSRLGAQGARAPPLFFDPTEARMAETIFLETDFRPEPPFPHPPFSDRRWRTTENLPVESDCSVS